MINYWEYLVLNIVIKLQHIGNFFFFVSVNIVIKLCVVVVHSCKLQGHIKHEWEGYLGNVGQRCKAKNGEDPWLPPLCDKSVRAWLPKADKHCLMAGQVPTINIVINYWEHLVLNIVINC